MSQFEDVLRKWTSKNKQSGDRNVLLSVWGKSGLESASAEKRCELLLHLCQLEKQRIEVIQSTVNAKHSTKLID